MGVLGCGGKTLGWLPPRARALHYWALPTLPGSAGTPTFALLRQSRLTAATVGRGLQGARSRGTGHRSNAGPRVGGSTASLFRPPFPWGDMGQKGDRGHGIERGAAALPWAVQGILPVLLEISLAAKLHGHYLSVAKTRAEKLQTSRNFSDMKRASTESCC